KDDWIVVGERNAVTACLLRGLGYLLRRRAFAQRLDRSGLGDVPVLTELAAQVAASGPEAQHACPREKVVQRLFFYGVDAKPRGAPIGREHDVVAHALAYETERPLPLAQAAMPRTQVALHPPVVELVMPATYLTRQSGWAPERHMERSVAPQLLRRQGVLGARHAFFCISAASSTPAAASASLCDRASCWTPLRASSIMSFHSDRGTAEPSAVPWISTMLPAAVATRFRSTRAVLSSA